MKSYSQVGQDRFAYAMNGGHWGTFLDVGAHDGFVNSNTAGLEEVGWTGLLVDIQRIPGVARRVAQFLMADATCADWPRIIELYFNGSNTIDYLSLDVDEATTPTLERILTAPVKFRAITIEHDMYRLGPRNRLVQHDLLGRAGYDLVCCDVCVGPGEWGAGGPYEDWWAHPDLVEQGIRDKWRCCHRLGTQICLESSS